MSKKMMVLALAVACAALFALPAVASAQTWHISSTTTFSVTGSGGTLTSSLNVTCTGTSGSGTFSTTTEGTVTLKFSGCKEVFNLPCTTSGQSSGVIAATAKFDGVMLSSTATKTPGVLLTPDLSAEPTPGLKEFNNFVCFGITVKVFGKGVIGTVTSPTCGSSSTTAGLAFSSSATGVQAHQTYTGNSFDLLSNISSSHPTSSLDGSATLTFPSSQTLTCT